MGPQMCQAKSANRNQAEFFYKSVNENQLDLDNAKEKVRLIISMTNTSYNSKYSVGLITYSANNRQNGHNSGETEVKTATGNQIKFEKFFVMEYYFEKEQPMGFVVQCNDTKFNIDTSLGKIMGGRGQEFTADLNSGEKLTIQGKSLVNNATSGKFEVSLSGQFGSKAMHFIIKNLGTQSNPTDSMIYRSEAKVANGNNLIEFEAVSIPTLYLCAGDTQHTLIGIEISSATEKFGETKGVFDQLITRQITIQLKTKGLPQSATIKCKFTKQYAFLDYLRGGMQIALTIAIDFTGSNKNPQHPQSLHNITSPQMNSYERAIKSCGDIVAYYDYDQLFPVFGYGAILPGANEVNHCFPLNRLDDPNIHTINGVLSCYRTVVPTLNFYGPTYFAPIINELNNTVKQDLASGKTMVYNILMILTDGQINDMADTIDALVEASFLPVSVIIIGIGMADFGNMDILDADDEPLYDRRHRKAARDLVQFVPFFKFQNDGQKLSEEVLEEVPRQVIEYYEQNNIIPSDPIIPLMGEGNKA